MGLRIEGEISVQQMLLRLDAEGSRRVVWRLYQHALKVRDLARKFAPVDLGNLEEAIKVRPERFVAARDAFGRFARQEIEVYVDESMPVPHGKNKTVGDYAYEIHEHLYPYGSWKLGKNSQAKQATQNEVVGGGFLERAAEEIEAQLDEVLLDIFRDL